MTLDERLRAAQDDLTAPGGEVPDSGAFVRARTRRRYSGLGVAAVLLLAAGVLPVALGSGDDDGGRVIASGVADLRDLLLEAGEVPGEWQQTGEEGLLTAGGSCGIITERQPDRMAERAFMSPPVTSVTDLDLGKLTMLVQRMTDYATVDDAEEALAEIDRTLASCREVDTPNPDGGRTRGTVEPLELDVDADEYTAVSVRMQLTAANGQEMPAGGQLVVFREADTVTVLLQVVYRDELPGGLQAIVDAAAAKVTAAGR